MIRRFRSSGAASILLAAAFLFLPAQSHAQSAVASKLETLIKDSGYKSASKVKDKEAVWTLDFSGKQLPRFKVVVTASEKDGAGIITAVANPVAKDQLPRNRANLTAAVLKANNDFDYVKFGFDTEGDVFVRGDIPPGVDLASFKAIVAQVAAAADDFYGRIKSQLRDN
jgi:Putative bacterial sensory transduction regulator